MSKASRRPVSISEAELSARWQRAFGGTGDRFEKLKARVLEDYAAVPCSTVAYIDGMEQLSAELDARIAAARDQLLNGV